MEVSGHRPKVTFDLPSFAEPAKKTKKKAHRPSRIQASTFVVPPDDEPLEQDKPEPQAPIRKAQSQPLPGDDPNPKVQRALKLTARMLEDLESESPFFDQEPPVPVTLFDSKEIQLGGILGEGEFGTVREVTDVALNGKFENTVVTSKEQCPLYRSLSSSAFGEIFEDDPSMREEEDHILEHPEYGSLSRHELARLTIKELSYRNGRARYAVKRVREDLQGERRIDAAMDLAAEAMFLSSLSHPNIVRLRGAAGLPGHPDFMVVMDRLYLTLEQKIEIWNCEASFKPNNSGGGGFFNSFRLPNPMRNGGVLTPEVMERVTVAYDIARALNFLHERKVVFRDLKPQNLGFDVRGNIRLFDFGVAKELKKRDHVEGDLYACTPLTGTRRWMAPEVVLGKPYGLKADVYSFSLLFWHLVTLQTPFGSKITPSSHMRKVAQGGRRPRIPKFLPPKVKAALRDCWHTSSSKRPKLGKICVLLSDEIAAFQRSGRGSSILNRTVHLKAFSTMSLQRALENIGGISTKSDLKAELGAVQELEATETEMSVERSAMVRLLSQKSADEEDGGVETRLFISKTLPKSPSIYIQPSSTSWVERSLFGSSIRSKMPSDWRDVSLTSPETRELWQNSNPTSVLLKIEVRRSHEGEGTSSYFGEIVETCDGVAQRCHSIDSHVTVPELEEQHKATFSYAKGAFQVTGDDVGPAVVNALQVELCTIHFPSSGDDLVVALSTVVPPTASQHAGLSNTLCRFVQSIRVDDLTVFQ